MEWSNTEYGGLNKKRFFEGELGGFWNVLFLRWWAYNIVKKSWKEEMRYKKRVTVGRDITGVPMGNSNIYP